MNVVDSSGWLEFFADRPNAEFFAPAIKNIGELLVPTISIYEVFKRVLQQVDEEHALEAVALMMAGRQVPLDVTVALAAAKLSDELKLPMADSIMLATAQLNAAILWTQDADFAAIDGVMYTPKPAA